MARFYQSNTGGSGSDTYDIIYTTHNSDGTNVKIGDDAWIGDVDESNRLAVIGVEDATQGGIIFGDGLTEIISSDGSNLTIEADNDIILYPGSSYAYLGTPTVGGETRIATLGDLIPGAQGDPGPQGDPGVAGADGNDGSPGLVYLGNYISGNGYVANIAVVKGSDNNLYIATSSGGLGDPVGNTAEWAIFLPKGADGAQGDPGPQGDPGTSGTSGLETSTRYSPTFTATGLTFTGSGATYPTYNSYYVKAGKLVSFVIEVDCTTVTNFGTGQYKLQLPFTPAVGFNHFSGWAWADPNVDPDTGTGHTIINADTAGITDVLDLHYLKQSGGANSPIREGLFLQGTPVVLTTISKIYVNGTYISQ